MFGVRSPGRFELKFSRREAVGTVLRWIPLEGVFEEIGRKED